MSGNTNPIRIDWVPTSLWPGRLGLTFAPGKKGPSLLQPGVEHNRDLAEDFRTLRQQGMTLLVSLLEPAEYNLLGIADYAEQAQAQDIEVITCPVPDRCAPENEQAFEDTLQEALGALLDGQNVVLHCRGGLGRTGTLAACLLVRMGLDAETATARVRSARKGAIETGAQEEFIRRYADSGTAPQQYQEA
ncbi:cyclin-dependent kinase inhibitor 3 family protein [Deinococcus sp. Marseille-Q6407]|uniref:cyclin-dependent kinase inhibitor 3 family protein n=1 Tax=Deinococcus sp. Marseille-Q6407 TaxID=2969223 RepID=UPI0021C1D289|nr:cyclin-dependent kinase inhibitor 3 family protein [Deinococcus sp. Marseille-Q6407]